tara:strand:+ start:472 stop:1161 length:690 start_codon:yes stop_codon:yes gene_type:complete
MHRLINKKKIYFYIFSFLFLSTISNQQFLKNIKQKFIINKIIVDSDTEIINNVILSKTKFLIDKNIFLINKKLLYEKLNTLDFLENIKITKNYPSTIKISAKKTNLIAITYFDQKKYYVGSNGFFISFNKISYQDKLPIIFGNFDIPQFFFLREKLREQKIDYKKIIKYFYHKNNRWDLYFENNTVIKLPEKKIDKALNLFKQFSVNNKINPNTIIDLRIPKRLIVTNE